MRLLTTSQLNAARHGAHLSNVCLMVDVTSTSHLRRLLAGTQHPLMDVLAVVVFTRQRTGRRYNWNMLLQQLRNVQADLPRWVTTLLECTFSLYRVIRHAARPRGFLPLLRTESGASLPRAIRRSLRHAGVRVRTDDMATVHEQAQRVWLTLWRSLANRHAVLWFDNFYKPRYLANPGRAEGSLNCAVMAVLHTTDLSGYQGLPPVSQLRRRAMAAGAGICSWAPEVIAAVGRIRALPLKRDDFRVPLDVVRDNVRSLQWRPFSLNDDRVSSQSELCATLRTCRWVLEHSHVRRPMPLLADENICYRVWKMAFSKSTQAWDVAGFLRDLPVLYGVWHPYKYVLEVVHRRFLSLFVYLQHGPLVAGATVPTGSWFIWPRTLHALPTRVMGCGACTLGRALHTCARVRDVAYRTCSLPTREWCLPCAHDVIAARW